VYLQIKYVARVSFAGSNRDFPDVSRNTCADLQLRYPRLSRNKTQRTLPSAPASGFTRGRERGRRGGRGGGREEGRQEEGGEERGTRGEAEERL